MTRFDPRVARCVPLGRPAGRRPGTWIARDAPPAELTTLASVRPDQAAEVRSILAGVGESAGMLLPGDVVVCRGRTADWVIVQRDGRDEIAIHRDDARRIQIEREGSSRRW
jgi:hypothetical protein